MIPYILVLVSLGLTGLVAFTRTRLAPVIAAASLVANIAAVEMAYGWPATQEPPRQGVVWAAFLGNFVVISDDAPNSPPRLYLKPYSPELEGELKENGPMMYDMDAKGGDGTPGDNKGSIRDLSKEDFTSLEKHLGDKE